MGNFVSTQLAAGAQVKQFLGVCEGVFGELSSGTGGLSNTGAPPVQVGLPRVGGAHPSAEGPARGAGTLIPSAQRFVSAAKQPLGSAALGALFA